MSLQATWPSALDVEVGELPRDAGEPAAVYELASRLAELAIHDQPFDYFDSYRQRIVDVSHDEVLSAAQHHLRPEEADVVIVGDAGAVRAEVERARALQRVRLAGTGVACNAELTPALAADALCLQPAARNVLRREYERGLLSARGQQRLELVDSAGADVDRDRCGHDPR
ncbi:MAG: hypothetical protein KY433_01415 [Actinobacteria bacterium]|nr:hypothetical protein [Actinomycetota bacterium]